MQAVQVCEGPVRLSLAPPFTGKWKGESQSTLLLTPESLRRDGSRFTVSIPAGAARIHYTIAAALRLINGNISGGFRVAGFRPAELTIRCNQDITFAAINDPDPAGCEAVDPELAAGGRVPVQLPS